MSSTQQQLLSLLKRLGPSPVAPLASELEMTTMGARQHLEKLEQQQLVGHFDKRQGKGRPSRHWHLTRQGHQSFGDRHNDVAIQMINSIVSLQGKDAVDQVLAHRAEQQLAEYSEKLSGTDDLPARLALLAELRTQEGYLARVEQEGEQWLLIEDHCPICSAAAACQGFCRNELALFRQLLAPAQVEREQHILAGAHRCCYRVSSGKA
ncbi:metalloregulator ArsR/SmtB family transcription factor [Ferrimonas sp. YFM]|uniref:helix-turn-helix transcriptional regulator n=1 Tax=Ferrimonas sp. YFM TaxID=3028878 RepID=UPI0025747D20|nr:metalloregulator ArsR/SmtB family transcription factor [Ferrimonas sp. YFM]BDY04726.1 transcriptional regulator [Ferrimonas sp. YFM]